MFGKITMGLCIGLVLSGCGDKSTAFKSNNELKSPSHDDRNYVPSLYVQDDPVPQNTKIVVNIPARELRLYHEGELVYRFPVAVGSPVFKTPVGERKLSQIVWNPWWMPPDSKWAEDSKPTPPGPGNPLGLAKLDLGGAILLHGTNKEYTVGHPASHGCMRMFAADVKALAWWVQSHFTEKTDPELLKTYAAHRGSSYYVNLKNSIPVEIKYNIFEIQEGKLKIHPDVYGKAGKRKDAVLAWLNSKGVGSDKVDEVVLAKALDSSTVTSQEVALRDLIPAKLMASNTPLSDPVTDAWQNEHKPKFSSLMPAGL
ncbi:L,D-transpeptidase [bacterium]|nr:L,D-transpeptidase [bacterium]